MHLDVNWDCVFVLYCFCEVSGLIHALANCNALIIIVIIIFLKITDILISFFATLILKTLFLFPIPNSWAARVRLSKLVSACTHIQTHISYLFYRSIASIFQIIQSIHSIMWINSFAWLANIF